VILRCARDDSLKLLPLRVTHLACGFRFIPLPVSGMKRAPRRWLLPPGRRPERRLDVRLVLQSRRGRSAGQNAREANATAASKAPLHRRRLERAHPVESGAGSSSCWSSNSIECAPEIFKRFVALDPAHHCARPRAKASLLFFAWSSLWSWRLCSLMLGRVAHPLWKKTTIAQRNNKICFIK